MSRFDDRPSLARMALDLYHVVGYNHYREENHLRADDQKVRALVCEILGRTRKDASEIESAYRRGLPAPSRANPFPPADVMSKAKRLEAIVAAIGGVEGQVRHAPVPENDRMTQRYRQEGKTLERLIDGDTMLVGQAEALRQLVSGKGAEDLLTSEAEVREGVAAITASLGARQVLVM